MNTDMFYFEKIYSGFQNLVDNTENLFSEITIPIPNSSITDPGGIYWFMEICYDNYVKKNNSEITQPPEDTVPAIGPCCITEDTYYPEKTEDTYRKSSSRDPLSDDDLFPTKPPLLFNDLPSVFEAPAPEENHSGSEDKEPSDSQEEKTVTDNAEAHKSLIMSIATFRDNLKLRRQLIATQEPDAAQQLIAIIDSILSEAAGILRQHSVTILDKAGNFDSGCQIIVGAENTSDKTMDNVISDTLRDGYIYRGEILRPQEVIVFSYNNEVDVCH